MKEKTHSRKQKTFVSNLNEIYLCSMLFKNMENIFLIML